MRCILFPLFIFISSHAFAYGPAGHEAVGTIAERQLAGTRALTQVEALLNKGETLARASTWADRAKFPEKYLSAEMKEFVTNNPQHHSFHYCDVPFQETAYRLGLIGTHKQDIVHIMEICIQVLQAPADDSVNSLKINKRVALMLLTHLVGDLHQPLHVGCSYIDAQDQFVNPETGAKGQEDAGANYLHVKTRSGTPLHGYWDTQTVKLARDHLGTDDFPAAITRQTPVKPEWDATGPIITWPTQWATDTLSFSRLCFQDITPRDRFLVPKNEKHEEHFEWIVTLSPTYPDHSRDIVEIELAKAGYRLGVLLKAIWPDAP